MPRLVVLGCGTGVGKTRVSVALLRALARQGAPTLGLKPVESGVVADPGTKPGSPPHGSDAARLASAGSLRASLEHPLYALATPVSPHLAARLQGLSINVKRAADWVMAAERDVAPLVSSDSVIWSIVETAGGVFSALAPDVTNFELGQALEPAIWVLVAADGLGVLHDTSATLQAMAARGRSPDHVVLSAARTPDASTGSNAAELATLKIATPSAVLARDDDHGIDALVQRLLSET